MINGALAGLVSVTAGSVVIQPWAGIVLGLLGGVAYCPHCFHFFLHSIVMVWLIVYRYELASAWLVRMGIDDPVNASPVHLFGGVVGELNAHEVCGSLSCDRVL